jgi:hypothetical protein
MSMIIVILASNHEHAYVTRRKRRYGKVERLECAFLPVTHRKWIHETGFSSIKGKGHAIPA